MGLPTIIEHILSLRRQGGGRLAYNRTSQQIVATFPPATALVPNLVYQIAIPANDYVNILYKFQFGQAMNAGAFIINIHEQANSIFVGTITMTIRDEPLDCYVPIFKNSPAQIEVTNLSGINQYYELNSSYIGIATEEDWNFVLQDLKERGL